MLSQISSFYLWAPGSLKIAQLDEKIIHAFKSKKPNKRDIELTSGGAMASHLLFLSCIEEKTEAPRETTALQVT